MLATVKGDVHDIGKNLVDIILHQQRLRGEQPRHQGVDRRHGGQGKECRGRRISWHERPPREAVSTLIMRKNLRGDERARAWPRSRCAARRRRSDPQLRRRPARATLPNAMAAIPNAATVVARGATSSRPAIEGFFIISCPVF